MLALIGICIGILYLIVGLVLGVMAFLWGSSDPYREYSLWRLAFWSGMLFVGWVPLHIYRWLKDRPEREREATRWRDYMRDRLAWKFMHEVE